jgi:hypothetical protein
MRKHENENQNIASYNNEYLHRQLPLFAAFNVFIFPYIIFEVNTLLIDKYV